MSAQRRARVILVIAGAIGLVVVFGKWGSRREQVERVPPDNEAVGPGGAIAGKSADRLRSHTREAMEQERKRAAAMRMILSLAEDADTPSLDLEDEQSIRSWCGPLLEMDSPVMGAFIEAASPYGGHAVMVTAMIISALEWKAAVEELMLLVDSLDVRRQSFARMVLSGLYMQWDLETREAYGALDLPSVLSEQYRKHGPLSPSVRGAVQGLWDEAVTEGPAPLIDEKWFRSPEYPEKFRDLDDPVILEAALRSDSWNVRAAAMAQAFWDPKADLFLAGLNDDDHRVVLSALQNLIESPGRSIEESLVAEPAYESALRRSQSASDPRLRAVATQLCGRLLTSNASSDAGPLVSALSDPHPSVRQFALDALREAERFPGGEEGRVLDMLTTSRDLGVRLSAAKWIERGGSDAAQRELDERLEQDELIFRYLAFVLEDTTGP